MKLEKKHLGYLERIIIEDNSLLKRKKIII